LSEYSSGKLLSHLLKVTIYNGVSSPFLRHKTENMAKKKYCAGGTLRFSSPFLKINGEVNFSVIAMVYMLSSPSLTPCQGGMLKKIG
jgi:hypothetical protein